GFVGIREMNLADISKLPPSMQQQALADQARASAARERIMAQVSSNAKAAQAIFARPPAKSPPGAISAAVQAILPQCPGEEWRPVAGFEGKYAVSSHGRVISFRRNPQGRLMTSYPRPRNYRSVVLSSPQKDLHTQVHRLVANAFIPNPEGKPGVNHKDGNPENNVVGNLEWATHAENMLHAVKTGLKPSKLSLQDTVEIRQLYEAGAFQDAIATKFGISQSMVSFIVQGKRMARFST
ncbi:MAG TPA: NUMOD4 domain-containing protein, partial [Bacteroidia bacterium]|nr:NUMOD4 domain-containing protein [Bacteroidia bacterium]